MVADHYEQPIAVMARQLATPEALAVEAARLLVRAARLTAERLVAQDGRPPEGADFFDRLILAHYTPLFEAKKAAARANQKKAFDAEMKAQRQRAKSAKEQQAGTS